MKTEMCETKALGTLSRRRLRAARGKLLGFVASLLFRCSVQTPKCLALRRVLV